MGFSIIVPAVSLDDAEAALTAAGYGTGNFVVPLMQGAWVEDHPHAAYALASSGSDPVMKEAVSAIPHVSIHEWPDDASEFDQHLAALGLSREPTPEPTEDL
jgi:hypothetical protein